MNAANLFRCDFYDTNHDDCLNIKLLRIDLDSLISQNGFYFIIIACTKKIYSIMINGRYIKKKHEYQILHNLDYVVVFFYAKDLELSFVDDPPC